MNYEKVLKRELQLKLEILKYKKIKDNKDKKRKRG